MEIKKYYMHAGGTGSFKFNGAWDVYKTTVKDKTNRFLLQKNKNNGKQFCSWLIYLTVFFWRIVNVLCNMFSWELGEIILMGMTVKWWEKGEKLGVALFEECILNLKYNKILRRVYINTKIFLIRIAKSFLFLATDL